MKIKKDDVFFLNGVRYIIKEFFKACDTAFYRCVDDKKENKYFTKAELVHIIK